MPHANSRASAPIVIVYAVMAVLGLCLCLVQAKIAQVHLPSARSSSPGPNPQLPTLFVVGDSTANNHANGARGWGDPLAGYFDATKVNVLNRARAGRSSRTFVTEGLWEKVLGEMKAGDSVLIQFGHNDGGPLDTGRARGSLPGLGEETQEVTTPDGTKEVVHTYGWYLRKIIAETKAKGATPIVCSLVPRKIWKDGKIVRNSGDYAKWAAEVAKSEGVAWVDLNEIIARKYDALGPEKVDPLFADPHTHTSLAGAELNAACVVAGLKALSHNPLAPYFSAKAAEVRQAEVK